MRPAPRPPKPALHTLRIENAVDDFRAGYAARRSRSRTREGPPIRTRQQAPLASNRRLNGQDKRGTQRSLRLTRSASAPDPPRVAQLNQCCIREPTCEAALRTELLNARKSVASGKSVYVCFEFGGRGS